MIIFFDGHYEIEMGNLVYDCNDDTYQLLDSNGNTIWVSMLDD